MNDEELKRKKQFLQSKMDNKMNASNHYNVKIPLVSVQTQLRSSPRTNKLPPVLNQSPSVIPIPQMAAKKQVYYF
jgi:hypothetical protein